MGYSLLLKYLLTKLKITIMSDNNNIPPIPEDDPKEKVCQACKGKGCDDCDYTGN